jgi:phage terminase large subunit-like protein
MPSIIFSKIFFILFGGNLGERETPKEAAQVTEPEATKVLDGLRQAVRTLNPMAARQAFNALMNNPRVVTTAMRRAAEAGDAVQTLIRAFDEIEGNGIRFPSN